MKKIQSNDVGFETGARMMGSHLLRHISKFTIALLNTTGVVVFYVAFSDTFLNFTYNVPITIMTVVAIRLSFCILTHQAIATLGKERYLFFLVIMLIGLAPALTTVGPIPKPIVIQLALDCLIVLITAALHSPKQLASISNPPATFVIPDRAIALDEVMKGYGVREYGAFFIYLPQPLQRHDIKANAWINILKENQIVKSCYHVHADHATKAARHAQPHLFDRHVDAFDVYRLDENYLRQLQMDHEKSNALAIKQASPGTQPLTTTLKPMPSNVAALHKQ
ncbi:MAG: hypothetical protein AAGA73_06610 [Pseudomonadota bacterium]